MNFKLATDAFAWLQCTYLNYMLANCVPHLRVLGLASKLYMSTQP